MHSYRIPEPRRSDDETNNAANQSSEKQAANLLTGYERKSDLIEGAVA